MSIEKLSTNASLKQVMDKFEEISLLDLSSIDIVVKTELPKTVKNGQYVIIDSNTNLGVVSSYFTEDEDTNKIFIYLSKVRKTYSFDVTNKYAVLKNYISFVRKTVNSNKTYLNSYLGINGEWVQITHDGLFRFKDGEYQNTDIFGTPTKQTYGSVKIVNNNSGNYLEVYDNVGISSNPAYNINLNSIAFDVTNYSELKFDIKELYSGYTATTNIGITTTKSGNFVVKKTYGSQVTLNDTVVTLDVSNITGTIFIKCESYSNSQGGYNYIRFNSVYFI